MHAPRKTDGQSNVRFFIALNIFAMSLTVDAITRRALVEAWIRGFAAARA